MQLIKKQDETEKRAMMLSGPLGKVIITMSIPSVISMLVSSFYNLIDSYYVSQLGKDAIGAVGLSLSLDNIVSILGVSIAAGAASYISRLLGAKKNREAMETLSVSFFVTLATGVIIGIFGLLYQAPLMRFLGAREEGILGESLKYSKFLLIASPIAASSFVLNQCLRAEGSPIYSMFGMIIGAVLNCGLCPLFVFGFGWGVAGAGAANMTSKMISFVILMIPYLRGSSIVKLSIKNFKLRKETVIEVGKMGLPTLSQRILTTFVSVVSNNAAADFGVAAIAAISICNRAMNFFASALMGLGQGYQPVIGYNWGAEEYERVWKSFWFTIKAGVFAMFVVCATVFIFSEPFIKLFSPADEEVLRIGLFAIRTQCIAMPIGATVVTISMTLTALGRATAAFVLGISRQGICYIPMILLLPGQFGVLGLAAAAAAADVLSVFIGIPLAIVLLRDVRLKLKQQRAETLNA